MILPALRAETELREIPSKDGIHKNHEVAAIHYFIDDCEVAAAAFKHALFPGKSK